MSIFKKKTVTTVEETVKVSVKEEKKENSMDAVAPKSIGKLDMVIAFDTTGSMAAYIGAVHYEVSQLIPRLFKDNDDLRLGIVAFGDCCDMENAQIFGDAYQCMPITNNENDLIKFVKESKDTSGGDGDSTGTIAGNIIGAIHGYSAIPDYYLKDLEIESVVVSAADDLCADVKDREIDQRIGERYVKHLPIDVEKIICC